jgi:hypothetical protein
MITLSTIVYEGNFRKLLQEDSWFLNYKSKYISKKRLNFNNVYSVEEFYSLLDKVKNEQIEVVDVSVQSENANNFFKINTDLNTYGYNYIMPYFTDLLTISTEYVFNVASDCQDRINFNDDFFENSINILNEDDDVMVTTLPWNDSDSNLLGGGEQKHTDSININKNIDIKVNDNFWFSKVMSDQVFVAKIEKLKKCDFTITQNLHPYPSYGGFAFEIRLGNHFMINDKYRAIFKTNGYYIHGKD